MLDDVTLWLFGAVIFASYAVQTVSGFGAMLVAVTLGANVLPIRDVLTLAVPLSCLQTTYILVRHRDGVRWGLLLKRVMPIMGMGVVLGFTVFAGLESTILKRAFGGLILLLSLKELWQRRPRARADQDESGQGKLHPLASGSAIFGAGIVHGVFATGGPLLVYALGREGLGKHAFRSTLAAVWWILNIALVVAFTLESRYDVEVAKTAAWLLPGLPLGIVVGEWLHHRVDEAKFQTGIFVLLLAAAVSLLVR